MGSRIAVLAEVDDDLSTLEIPPEENAPEPPKKESKEAEQPKEEQPKSKPEKSEKRREPSKEASGSVRDQSHPLTPSVAHLLHEHGLSAEEYNKIPSTGPKGRLLKGDVLAYIGDISSSYPKELERRVEKLEKLDLSNIKIKEAQKRDVPPPKPEKSQEPALPTTSDIQITIRLSEALKVQKRIQDTLGTHIPLATFIARAIDIANDNLPRSPLEKPSQDELFNQILGLDKVKTTSTGAFMPQIAALPVPTRVASPRTSPSTRTTKADIIDILSGNKSNQKKLTGTVATVPFDDGVGSSNIFSVTVEKGDEKRGKLFLERIKAYLEAEPGRLIL